jgi:hypothetical protein
MHGKRASGKTGTVEVTKTPNFFSRILDPEIKFSTNLYKKNRKFDDINCILHGIYPVNSIYLLHTINPLHSIYLA